MVEFVQAVMRPGADNRFIDDFATFTGRVATGGMLNSLSQLLLKIASRGVPDFYQGSELWDLSLVDPDRLFLVDSLLYESPTLPDISIRASQWDVFNCKRSAGKLRENRTGWRSGLDLSSRDFSIQPSWIVVSIPLAMNWPHFLVANA